MAPSAEELEKIEKRKQKFGDSLKTEEPATSTSKTDSKKESQLEKKLDMSLSDLTESSKASRGRGKGRERGRGRGRSRGRGRASRGRGGAKKDITPDDIVVTKTNEQSRRGGRGLFSNNPNLHGEDRGFKRSRNE